MNTTETTERPVQIDVLTRVLDLRGVELDGSVLAESCGGDVSLFALARECTRRGKAARVVSVDGRTASSLSMPALVVQKQGHAAVLFEMGGRYAAVEIFEEGRLQRRHIARCELDGSVALEIDAGLVSGRSYLVGLARLLAKEWSAVLHVAAASALLVLAALLMPVITSMAVDEALGSHARHLLYGLAAATVVVSVQHVVFGTLRRGVLRRLDGVLELASLVTLFRQIVTLPFAAVRGKGVGALNQALLSAETVAVALVSLGLAPLIDLVIASGYVGALAWTSPAMAVLAVTTGIVGLTLAAFPAYRQAALQVEEIAAAAHQQGAAHEIIEGIATVQACGAESSRVAQWLRALSVERGLWYRKRGAQTLVDALLQTSHHAVVVGIFAIGGMACLEGRISAGRFLACLMLADGFAMAVLRFGTSLAPLLATRAHIERVDELLGMSVLDQPPSSRTDLGRNSSGPGIRVRDVWFRYEESSTWVLRGESLEVAEGTVHHLRGASGAGKSTMLRLLAGLYRSDRGSAEIFGRPTDQCQQLVLYLPQTAHLFEGSIISNLRLMSMASDRRILDAAEQTGLLEWIESLPMKFETIVPPGGGTFSGGQRQLLLLTAAIASERPVLLLDEPMSHLDRATVTRLHERDIFAGKTVLVVSHDPHDAATDEAQTHVG